MKVASFERKKKEMQDRLCDQHAAEIVDYIMQHYQEWRRSDEAVALMSNAIHEIQNAINNNGGSADRVNEQLFRFYSEGFFAGMDYQDCQIELLKKQILEMDSI